MSIVKSSPLSHYFVAYQNLLELETLSMQILRMRSRLSPSLPLNNRMKFLITPCFIEFMFLDIVLNLDQVLSVL